LVLAALFLTLFASLSNAQTACNVIYTISPQNTSQFGASITIDNTGTTAWTSWTLTWAFANGQTVSQLWNGIETQSGANVTVKNEPYNGSVSAGGSVQGVGFNGTWNGVTNAVPTSFAVNGTTCGATGSFSLKPSAASLSIAQGASGTDTITVTDVSPFAGSVTLAASGLPTGVTVAYGTNPTATTSVLTFTASATATTGTSNVTITGTSGSLSATTSIALTVAPKTGSFSLSPSAAAVSVVQGGSFTDTITVKDVSPFAGSVTLAATGCTFATNPTATTSVMTCTVSSTAPVGTSTIIVTGTSGTLTATTTVAVTVTAKPGFTLAASPTSCTIPQGGSCTDTITVTDTGGFTGTVTLTATSSNSGVTATLSGDTLTIKASSTATGTATITVIGTSGTTTYTITIPVTIIPSTGSFTLGVSGTPTVAQGSSTTLTIAVTDVSPFSGTVTLSHSAASGGITISGCTSPITGNGSCVLTITASSTATLGGFAFTLTGTSGTLTSSAVLTITVTAAVSISSSCGGSNPSPQVVQGGSSTCTFTVTGATSTPSIAASGLPSGVTVSFSTTNPSSGTYVITLTFAASSTAAVGTDTVTVTVTAGSTTKTFSIALTVTAAVTANAVVSVNPSNTGIAVTDMLLGMNMAAWVDIVANKTAIVDAFQTAGIKAVRWPGGSWSDVYHWATNSVCDIAPYATDYGQPVANDIFANFVSDLAVPAGLDVALTADYGTNAACTGGGVPSEAAAWAAAALTDGITVSHMTVGNEVYGSTWEEDLHSPANNAATYAAAVAGASGYYKSIKAASPNTLVGVVVDADNSGGGWDNTVLANAKGYYDFVEYHYYPEAPGAENDSTLINQDAQTLTTNINTVKSELAEWGTAGTPIYIGEMSSVYTNPGKQTMSITQALFAGQTLGEMMKDGVSRATWWIGFGGCADSTYGANFSSSLYGWQSFGGYMVFSDGLPDGYQCTAETVAAGTLLPTARAFQLFSQVLVNGEHVLTPTVTGDTADVVAYAATHSGGTALVLFNRNETTSETVEVELTGVSSASGVTETTYNKALYDETDATTPVWAAPTTTSLGTVSLPLTLTLTPWSMNVVIIP
jgi:hypothetical protein